MLIVTRQEATAGGLSRYFTGKPCKNGHVAERVTKTRACVACVAKFTAEGTRKRSISDPDWWERRLEKLRQWKRDNPERAKEAAAVANRAWRERNKEKRKVDHKRWRDANREKVRARSARQRAADPVAANEATRRSVAKHPETVRANRIVRRTREKAAGARLTGADVRAVFERQKGRCAECHKRRKLELDHIIPVARGGTSDASNIQGLCRSCNASKSARDPIEWAQSKGRLL